MEGVRMRMWTRRMWVLVWPVWWVGAVGVGMGTSCGSGSGRGRGCGRWGVWGFEHRRTLCLSCLSCLQTRLSAPTDHGPRHTMTTTVQSSVKFACLPVRAPEHNHHQHPAIAAMVQ